MPCRLVVAGLAELGQHLPPPVIAFTVAQARRSAIYGYAEALWPK
jgi:hypothetical protein